MLHLWYHTSAMILAWILEECLRCDTALVTLCCCYYYISYSRLLEAGHLNVCNSLVLVCLSCSMLCAAQWQKSPGVFMRKKDKKFTIEDGILIEIFITFTIFLLVRDNWEEVCNMSKPLVHTSIPGKIMKSALHYYNLW